MSRATELETPARERLGTLFREGFAGKTIDIVKFVDELMSLAAELGELRCVCVGAETLRFEIRGQDPMEVEISEGLARGKLRSLCARLAMLVSETAGQEFLPYGGEGYVVRSARATNGQPGQPTEQRFRVRYQNSNAAPIEVTITAL